MPESIKLGCSKKIIRVKFLNIGENLTLEDDFCHFFNFLATKSQLTIPSDTAILSECFVPN
ncbi:hypothetical protein SAMN04515674_104391 [Pseudarcicella hirudinis]|uniref:Uncharacterized protein n=1 Tax=Pseudarcicella hirudinis TaxID=1079859 RepID=A0A1I5S440_9BACT|nr:hypothetical protein SAMN04515674_104391 [Pseudarcicella hirudinis]